MIFHVDPHSGVPIFRQLIDQVKRAVAAGVLAPGDEVPSIRSLSVPLGVNPMTISKAYNQLVHENVLVHRPGLNLVVADHGPGDLARRRTEQLREALRPAVNLVRQLELPPDEAAAEFRRLLERKDRP